MNPVLHRELILNLRSPRAFFLQGAFLLLLGTLVAAAWPGERRIDPTNPTAARRLIDLFFGGQFLLASLTAPAFAAASLTGEKERKSYEMLLASALRPRSIVWGKWMASLAPSLLLLVSSLPIVMLCVPLGGVSFYEVAAAYTAIVTALACFTLVSLFASAYFTRTTAALLTSYLTVLPPTLLGLALWQATSAGSASTRLWLFFVITPLVGAIVSGVLFAWIAQRLWYPPDVGSEGREVIDEEKERRETIGLVLARDKFPDRLFAPAKRTEPLDDGANPVLDKELRSELFSQGTLMLRLVIQISLVLSVPIFGACLYLRPAWSPWYFCYVLLFNLLVGPAFSAGSVSNERERQTLDLLLTTTLSPLDILWGKLIGGLRVSTILTSFLLWPAVLACLLVPEYYPNIGTFLAMGGVVLLSCVLTSTTSLFTSVLCRKTSTSLMTAYLTLGGLFVLVPAADFFAESLLGGTWLAGLLHVLTVVSPMSAVLSLPLEVVEITQAGAPSAVRLADWPIFLGHIVFQLAAIGGLLSAAGRMFRRRYDVE